MDLHWCEAILTYIALSVGLLHNESLALSNNRQCHGVLKTPKSLRVISLRTFTVNVATATLIDKQFDLISTRRRAKSNGRYSASEGRSMHHTYSFRIGAKDQAQVQCWWTRTWHWHAWQTMIRVFLRLPARLPQHLHHWQLVSTNIYRPWCRVLK